MVKQCRMYAAKLRQGRKSYPLDYAITGAVAASNLGPTRLLTGERSFLYHCFYRCYAGSFSSEQMNLLYLYLLIKREFRSELVQTNGRRGFWISQITRIAKRSSGAMRRSIGENPISCPWQITSAVPEVENLLCRRWRHGSHR